MRRAVKLTGINAFNLIDTCNDNKNDPEDFLDSAIR